MFQTNPWPGANYNAVQQLVQPKPLALTNVDLTGKFGGADIYASVNRTQQGGSIAYLNGYTRNSARLNANQSIGSMWQIGVNTSSRARRRTGSTSRAATATRSSS
jgi:hypothetical protein